MTEVGLGGAGLHFHLAHLLVVVVAPRGLVHYVLGLVG